MASAIDTSTSCFLIQDDRIMISVQTMNDQVVFILATNPEKSVKEPTRLRLTLSQFEAFYRGLPQIIKSYREKKEESVTIGGNIFLMVQQFRGSQNISIRQWFSPEKDKALLLPSKRGFTLKVTDILNDLDSFAKCFEVAKTLVQEQERALNDPTLTKKLDEIVKIYEV